MSGSTKTVIAIVVVIILVFIGWAFFKGQGQSQPANSNYGTAPATQATQAPVSQAPVNTSPDVSSKTDTSDAAISADLSGVDNQMNNLNSDGTNIDQGISASSQ